MNVTAALTVSLRRMHDDAPMMGLYLPAPQGTQADAAVDWLFGLYLPTLHPMHDATPVLELYVPAPHPMHDDGSEEPVLGL